MPCWAPFISPLKCPCFFAFSLREKDEAQVRAIYGSPLLFSPSKGCWGVMGQELAVGAVPSIGLGLGRVKGAP